MPWVRRVVAAVVATGLGAYGLGRTSGNHQPPCALAALAAGKPAQQADRVTFSVGLRTDSAGAGQLVNAFGDSPFGGRIDAATFGQRFGLPDDELGATTTSLRNAGFTVGQAPPQRTSLRLEGTVATVERAFGVEFCYVRDRWGEIVRMAVGTPRIPDGVRNAVTDVYGLDTAPLMSTAQAAERPRTILSPTEIAQTFDFAPLWSRGFRGRGLTIAVVSFDSFNQADVATFDRLAGITGAPSVEKVLVDGPVPVGTGSSEVNLDIDVIRSVAPEAQILDYEAKNNGTTYAEVISKIVKDGRADIISISWGNCDDPTRPRPSRAADEREILAAAAAGISIFVSSGDTGAFDCQRRNPSDVRPTVDWPSNSASVVAVGGTRLRRNDDGSYLEEAGWEQVLGGLGGGGGLSPRDKRPAWQTGPGVLNLRSNGNRQTPDVAGPADTDSGFMMVHNGRVEGGSGTSQSAPFWAAVTALVKQFVVAAGHTWPGYVNPMLYRLAATTQPFPAFHDVVKGGNRFDNATPGWDYATGWGSPDVYNLARDAAAYLKR